jgi:hypothetical protein
MIILSIRFVGMKGGGMNPELLSARTTTGDRVVNRRGEDLLLDVTSGQVAYTVLSFGGLLVIGNKLFAIPWGALELDAHNRRFILDVDKDLLENAPGFDKDNWPENTDRGWLVDVYRFYGHDPYWE